MLVSRRVHVLKKLRQSELHDSRRDDNNINNNDEKLVDDDNKAIESGNEIRR